MRNLLARSMTRSRVGAGGVGGILHFCTDPDTGDVFYATEGKCIGRSDGAWQVSLPVAILADLEATDVRINSIAYSLELEALCVTTSAGHLLLLDPASQAFEEVGVIEGGVVAAAWSPEGELLALITGGALLILMNKDFEVLAEVHLLAAPERVVPSRQLPPEDPESAEILPEMAAIAWRGDGKFLATVSRAGSDGPGILRVWERDGGVLHSIGEHAEDLLCAVAWQPNGRHIYAAQELDGRPRIVLFELNGLQHGAIDVTGEGSIQNLQWSIDSELLGVHLASKAPLVRQSEGEEPLSEGESHIVQVWQRSNWHWYLKQEWRYGRCRGLSMQWSEAGNALTTCCKGGIFTRVELGSTVESSALGTAAVVDGSRLLLTPLRHSVVPPPLAAVVMRFAAPVQCFAFRDDYPQEAIVAALSDGTLGILESVEADLWEETAEEAEASTPAQLSEADGQELSLAATPVIKDTLLPAWGDVRCLIWVGERKVLAVLVPPLEDDSAPPSNGDSVAPSRDDSASGDVLLELKVPWEGQSATAAAVPVGRLGGQVVAAVSHPGGGALLQLATGRMLGYDSQEGKEGMLTPYSEADCFPKQCPEMRATLLTEAGASEEILPPAVGLSAVGELFLGQHLLASSVTSFTLHDGGATGAQLLYTTRDNFLHTRPLKGILTATNEQLVPSAPIGNRGKRPKGLGEGRGDNHYPAMHAAMRGHGAAAPLSRGVLAPRAVEQGSRIIAAPPGGYAVVLQMPRGNLETIYPRSLVLPALAVAVLEGRYAEAWQVATVHRVDPNLLVDYGWPRFLQNTSRFVDEVPYDQDLADLLAALRPESVVAEGGLYAGLPPFPSEGEDASPEPEGNKVPAVCRALRDAMQAADAELYLKPILASHAVLGELEAALGILKAAKEAQMAREASHQQASTSGSADVAVKMGQGDLGQWRRRQAQIAPTAEEGLSHLLLTVNVEQLYRAALGMYELELAYMVLAHSPQHDPGEYLLELQGFAAKPAGPLRRHAIDVHLGRMSSALRNLVEAGNAQFDTALALARKEGLLRELLTLVSDFPRRKEVLQMYGQWLSERSMHEDAAVAFLGAGDLEAALVEYRQGGFWQMALAVAGRIGWGAEQMRELAEELMDNLSGSSRLIEAAAIAAQHLGDADSAVTLLSQAREWREALRMAALFQRQDLVETTVAPTAAEAAATLLAELGEAKERIAKYDARLREVRVRRAAMQAAMDEGADGEDGEGPSTRRDLDDTASEGGSSIVSGLSAYTEASAGGASTQASTGRSPSTIGGKRPQRKAKKGKGTRIRQGSPEEEAALVTYIASLAPTPRQCTEAGQLTELLILLGHEGDARRVQALLSDVIAEQKAAQVYAAEEGQAGRTGGEGPGQPGLEAQALAKKLTAKPEDVNWKWDILRPV